MTLSFILLHLTGYKIMQKRSHAMYVPLLVAFCHIFIGNYFHRSVRYANACVITTPRAATNAEKTLVVGRISNV